MKRTLTVILAVLLLAALLASTALADAGLPAGVRAETLTMEQLARLTDAIYP